MFNLIEILSIIINAALFTSVILFSKSSHWTLAGISLMLIAVINRWLGKHDN